jgi:hypothetical protein
MVSAEMGMGLVMFTGQDQFVIIVHDQDRQDEMHELVKVDAITHI